MGKVRLRKSESDSGKLIIEMMLDIFGLNNRLIARIDELMATLGQSCSRWQVMRAIETLPRTVSDIAATMCLTRQGVQRITDEMEREELVEYRSNPRHKRAYLVGLTGAGKKMVGRMAPLQGKWARAIVGALKSKRLEECNETLGEIRRRLES